MSDNLVGREQEVLEALKRGGSQRAAAAILGVHHASVSRALRRLDGERKDTEAAVATDCTRSVREQAENGELGYQPVLPGYAIKETTVVYDAAGEVERTSVKQSRAPGAAFDVPAGQEVKGVSALLDLTGREILKWVKTGKEAGPGLEDVVTAIKAAFADYSPAARRTKAPAYTDASLLTLVPLADWHIGMHAWGREVGTDWDLKIAEHVIGRSAEEAIERSPASEVCVVLGGGDLLHADNQDNRTARSGNQLDVDGRYQKVVGVATQLLVRTVDAALRRHRTAVVRILKGNHDEHSAIAAAYFMLAWYRNEPRVTVDVDPSLFWWMRWGQTMFGATHGHEAKAKDMASIMAHRRAEDWGRTRFRYVHTFHLHHQAKFTTEGQGVITEIHQAPVPQDAWHYGSGFLSGRSIQSITYHQDFGEVSRARVAILDGAREAA
ncbi:helix-turn-helix domain-containing protein [Bosea robiniae]|uniref:Helix-turn-helix domain-containing protein n=1 Tax=Bosea robiniae TaxID=1036780 RepID=A0ABY0P4L0_9HYPH|nr:LysR family transcriptional regulator [Bosea robiniae]SDH22085.1 hypothetical protein SAMN05421844_107197 [Bosea robiniae]